MTNQLAVSNLQTTGLRITNITELTEVGSMLAKCGYFTDARDAAQAAVKVMAGLEIGIPAFASMTGIAIIKGKPTLSANLMCAVIKRSGKYDYRVIEHSRTGCKIDFFQGQVKIGTSEFTADDARDAGLLNNDNWKKYPRNMMFARAVSNGARWYCPDAFMGSVVYTPEEMGAHVDEEGNVIDVTPTVVEKKESNKVVDVVDDKKEHAKKCAKSIEWFETKYSVDKTSIFEYLNISSAEEMSVEQLENLREISALLKDGSIEAESMFRVIKKDEIEIS